MVSLPTSSILGHYHPCVFVCACLGVKGFSSIYASCMRLYLQPLILWSVIIIFSLTHFNFGTVFIEDMGNVYSVTVKPGDVVF